VDADHADPVQQVRAERPFGDVVGEVMVRRREYADIDLHGFRLSQPDNLALLQDT
jgi:hypothetical protein